MEICIIGQIHHVSRTNIHRIPKWAGRTASVGHDRGGEAGDIRLELGSIVQAAAIGCQELGLQLVIAVIGNHRNAAAATLLSGRLQQQKCCHEYCSSKLVFHEYCSSKTGITGVLQQQSECQVYCSSKSDIRSFAAAKVMSWVLQQQNWHNRNTAAAKPMSGVLQQQS